jgi:2-keto-myo-inositol isomerase
MIIGWNGETLPALPLAREVEVVAEAGYGGLELFIPKIGPFLEHQPAGELAARLRAAGLAPLSLNGIENINLRTLDEFAAVKRECEWLSELAQAIGCPTIVVVPSPRPPGMAWPEVKALTVDALGELACLAGAHGVGLAFEFLAPAHCSVRTLAQGWEVVQATGCEDVGLAFDTYHFCVGGSSWESLEEFDAGRLRIVHINDVEDRPLETLTDADRLLPGEGILPLGRMLARLKARGYDGAYSLEVMRPVYRQRDPLEYARAGREAIERALQFPALAPAAAEGR